MQRCMQIFRRRLSLSEREQGDDNKRLTKCFPRPLMPFLWNVSWQSVDKCSTKRKLKSSCSADTFDRSTSSGRFCSFPVVRRRSPLAFSKTQSRDNQDENLWNIACVDRQLPSFRETPVCMRRAEWREGRAIRPRKAVALVYVFMSPLPNHGERKRKRRLWFLRLDVLSSEVGRQMAKSKNL